IKIVKCSAQWPVQIAIEMDKTVRSFRGQLRGCIGKISLDETDVFLADESAYRFDRSILELFVLSVVDSRKILWIKTLKRIKEPSGFPEPPRDGGDQRRRFSLVDAELRKIARQLLLHNLIEGEAKKEIPRHIAVVPAAGHESRDILLELNDATAFEIPAVIR